MALLLGYAVLWAASATVRNFGLPLHGDSAEAYTLSRDLSIGYLKHPPLINVITRAWFSVMPTEQWAFYLLAFLNAALGMGFVWLAAGHVVDARRRILAVALLGLLPVFAFQAATFNHNTMPMSLWPLVALCFLLSIERSGITWSVLFGLVTALAILGKYYAGVLAIACVLAALLHPGRTAYFLSPRPYVAAATCVALLAPNLWWLVGHDMISISMHVAQQAPFTPAMQVTNDLYYLAAIAGLAAPALLVLWLVLRPSARSILRTVFTDWPGARPAVAAIVLAPILLPPLVLPLAGIHVSVPWAYPAFFFVPLLVVSAPGLVVTSRAVAATLGAAMVFAVVGVVVSPLLMIYGFRHDIPRRAQPVAELARIATGIWRSRTGTPLTYINGAAPAAWALSFYSPDHPSVFPSPGRSYTRTETETAMRRHGILIVCSNLEPGCASYHSTELPDAERIDVTLPMTFLGMSRAPVDYVLFVKPPAARDEN